MSSLAELPYLGARTSDPLTSHEAAESSKEQRGKIAEAILEKALNAGPVGITINEAGLSLPQFRLVSLSPVFKPLVKAGKLIRRTIGKTKTGKDIYETRVDSASNRKCIVHFHHTVAAKKPVASVVRPDVERRA